MRRLLLDAAELAACLASTAALVAALWLIFAP
jgi:hypothetical protein